MAAPEAGGANTVEMNETRAHWQRTAREPPFDLSRAANTRVWTVFELSGYQHDIIAPAVNELIDMLPDPPRASFSNEPDRDEGEHLAPDDDFGAQPSREKNAWCVL